MKLIIGNKNLSSWSLRPWVLMRHFGIEFEEQLIRLDQPDTRASIGKHSPSGMVPCLKDGEFYVWDSLAISEYLAERFPDRAMWPVDPKARARARCLAAEMHSGFSTLRTVWPMDVITVGAELSTPLRVKMELGRIFDLWTAARAEFSAGGDYLFGEFSIADAFFAPVVSRIKSYGPVSMPEVAAAYLDTMWANPAMQDWIAGAHQEAEAGWYR